MNKQEFLAKLRNALAGLPEKDIEERLSFYSEMIDDRMEEGLSEQEALSAVGSVEEITSQIIGETPLTTIAKGRVKGNRRLKTWEIILLVLGSPIWLSLGIAAIAVIFSLYISLWSVIVSLWAVFASVVASAFGVAAGGVALLCVGKTIPAMAMIASGLVCAGLSIFTYFGCKAATKGILALTKKIGSGIQNFFLKKGEV
jgi:uncharacterized membrane protein